MEIALIERLAAAHYEAGIDPRVEPAWEACHPAWREQQIGFMRTALRAMRYPSEAMFDGFMSVNAEPPEAGQERRYWEGDFGQFAASVAAIARLA